MDQSLFKYEIVVEDPQDACPCGHSTHAAR